MRQNLARMLRNADSERAIVNVVEDNFAAIRTMVQVMNSSEQDFDVLQKIMSGLFANRRYEYIVLLFSDFDFKEVLNCDKAADFTIKWVRAMNFKGKNELIAQNSDVLEVLLGQQREEVEIISVAKQQSLLPPGFNLLRGIELLLILLLFLMITVGFRGSNGLMMYTLVVLSIQLVRYLIGGHSKSLYIAAFFMQGLAICAVAQMVSFESIVPWAKLLLLPVSLVLVRWGLESHYLFKSRQVL